MIKRFSFSILSMACYCMLFSSVVYAAPPVVSMPGAQRTMNSILDVEEGNSFSAALTAVDPDGDTMTFSATNMPSWAGIDTTSGVITGTAPAWSDNPARRATQQGVFDIHWTVSDGTYDVTNILSIHVLDSGWTSSSMAEIVAARPISAGGDPANPVSICITTNEVISVGPGAGKSIRRVTFAFTSQVASVTGWEDDWVSCLNYAYLPVENPAVTNAGAVVEGGYSGDFGKNELGAQTCATLDIPVLVMNAGWTNGHAGGLMTKYNTNAVTTGNPHDNFYAYSVAHFLRSADALATVIDQVTEWPVTLTNFSIALTGHSKMGHTCFLAAAADPNRVHAIMPSGCATIDCDAYRLLGELQGATSTKPDASKFYLGTMLSFSTEPLKRQSEMSPGLLAINTMGTDDDRNRLEGYTPKYALAVSMDQLSFTNRTVCIPNLRHTTTSSYHAAAWKMCLASAFLDRPLGSIESVQRFPASGQITVEALPGSVVTANAVTLWSTAQSDTNVSNWDEFFSTAMTEGPATWGIQMTNGNTAFYVAASDLANSVTGLVTTAPWPLDPDYPLLKEAPYDVASLAATRRGAQVFLSWTCPESSDFAGVSLVYSPTAYPTNPVDGTRVYDGAGSSCVHSATGTGTRYYTAFSYDLHGNYSSGTNVVSSTYAAPTISDYDGDMKTDLPVYYTAGGAWYVMSASGSVPVWQEQWGTGLLEAVPGDYDGDGYSDLAVYDTSSGDWYIRSLLGDILQWQLKFGGSQFVPVPGDYDGDGSWDMAVYNQQGGGWYILSSDGAQLAWNIPFGGSGMVPVCGDYDGDAIWDLTVYDSASGLWYSRSITGGILAWADAFGGPGMTPVSGDYDGDGTFDQAVYETSTGNWYIKTLSGELLTWGVNWGGSGATPCAGDYDGDALWDMGIYYEQAGKWYVRSVSGNVMLWEQSWGGPGFSAVRP